MKKPLIVLLCLATPAISIGAPADVDPSLGCKSNPAVVAACYSIRGRISAYNGSPTFRIWPLGTTRMLGIEPSENVIVPENIKGKMKLDQSLIADLEVCPLTLARPGRMQFVCVESAANVEVRRKKEP